MMNANFYFGMLRYTHAYYVHGLVYLCRSLLEQQKKLSVHCYCLIFRQLCSDSPQTSECLTSTKVTHYIIFRSQRARIMQTLFETHCVISLKQASIFGPMILFSTLLSVCS